MGAIVYLLKTTIVNYFKRLKQKPQKAIGPIFVMIWLVAMFLPSNKNTINDIPLEAFICIFLLILVLVFIYSLYSGTKKLDSKFSMSDVNLIFVSPIKPQTVLLYGVVKKIAVELLASAYVLYQIPNFLKKLKVPVINQVMLIFVFIVFQLVFCNILKLCMFALSTKYKNLGSIIRNSIKAFFVCIAGGIVLLIVTNNYISFFENLVKNVTYNPNIKFIPIFGWLREMTYQTVTGIKWNYAIYLILILLVSGLLLYITYNMELDFYEDMLSSAENNDILYKIEKNKNGKNNIFLKPFKKTKLKLEGVYGAKVLFFKHVNEYSKRSFIFFVNTYSVILLLASVILGLKAGGLQIKFVFLVAAAILGFTAGFGGKIYSEISFDFIFLLPDSPQKKLFYGIASSLVKVLSDAVLLFLPFGILRRISPIEIFLCIICYVLLGGMLSYSGLFAFRIAQFLGFTGAIAQSLFFMVFQLLVMGSAFIMVLLITACFTSFNAYAIYAGFLIYSISTALLFSFGCVGLFDNMEM